MSYSIIGIISILVQLIINHDMLWDYSSHTAVPARKEYRDYIISMLLFCVTDVLWGFLNELRLIVPLYAVTVLFFVTMMVGFLLWTRYVAAYMEGNNRSIFRRILFITGIVLFFCEIVILIINFFVPIQFRFDENGDYRAGSARYVTLTLQVILFLMTFVYTFVTKAYSEQATKRLRRSFGPFCLLMASLIILQLYYPMLPLYSIGYLLSSCMLHSFVVEDERNEYRMNLEEMLGRIKQQSLELGDVKRKIYTDPLTGVGSKQAYMDDSEKIYQRICDGTSENIGAVVFDVNDLKIINDTMGHDAGDIYIYNASMLISEFFSKSPVYRIGGDEFVVILEGDAFKSRTEQLTAFDRQIENNLRSGKLVVSSGMAEYIKETDKSYQDIFERADTKMYQRKKELKDMQKMQIAKTL